MRVNWRSFGFISFIIASGISSFPAEGADCGLKRFTGVDTTPTASGGMLVPVTIGTTPKLLLMDTAGAISALTLPAARELGLNALRSNIQLYGIGGSVSDQYTILPSFTIGTVESKSVKMMILPGGGIDPNGRVAGTLAPNPQVDLDLDFGNNKLNLFSADHCPGQVVYWQASAVAVVPMRVDRNEHVIIPVTLDGQKVEALVDTGASTSVLNLRVAADRFKVDLNGPDVEQIGVLNNIASAKIYRRRFKTLAFEGVTVSNPMLVLMPDKVNERLTNNRQTGSIIRDSDVGLNDMILGSPVLSKLHVYIAYKERKVYITAANPAPDATAPAP